MAAIPPEQAVGSVVQLRRMLAGLSHPPALINTEWGFSSFGLGPDGHNEQARARQAVLAVRAELANWVSGLPIAIWYDVRDDCDDALQNECHFGLLDSAGKPKPALRAIETLSQVARGRRLTALLSDATGPRILRLQGAEDQVLVVWLVSRTASLAWWRPTRSRRATSMAARSERQGATLGSRCASKTAPLTCDTVWRRQGPPTTKPLERASRGKRALVEVTR